MKRRHFIKSLSVPGIFLLITPSGIICSCTKSKNGPPENLFRDPPASARPFTWWHWINGNVSKEGITLDLEAMAKTGVGGFQVFSADSGLPSGPADYLSPLWIDLMKHAAGEALRLGLEFDMHNCMGWSSSGGSWIPPELSMQQIVWTEASVAGGTTVNIRMAQPQTNLDYYRDTFVVAFPSDGGTDKMHVNDWQVKSNYPKTGKFSPEIDLDTGSEDTGLSTGATDPDDVIDITQFMNDRGELNWDAPAGNWIVIRFGHTTTGVTNHPAEGKGLGLECDKYSREALDFHFNYMLENVLPAVQPLADEGRFGMLIDSYEVDLQNWTIQMPQEFKKRSGYDIIKYLPVFTGRVVGNVNTSERFLWDFRRTCADLMAENYQGRFVELCREHNIISYTEPYNHSPFEQMQAGAKMDINLGEFWLKTGHFSQSVKLAASIQNMNERQIVAAESFTGRPYYSKWQEYPFAMKAQGDFMFTCGLNRIIFHRYAHQPHPTAVPGMTMGQWGFHFDRTNTWFFKAWKWLEYLSRCQYMLRQGLFAGDVMCFTGEEAPGDDISMGALRPDLPDGYDFQFANKDIILNRIDISDGKIILPDGLSFSLLLLPDKSFMTLEVARKLKDLVSRGMILAGPKPGTIPGLTDFSNTLEEFRLVVNEIWGSGDETPVDRKLGLGRVFSGMPIKDVLLVLGLQPDFKFTSRSGDVPVNYIHRKTKDGHIYFVANRRRFEEDITCEFRVSGFEPELWDPDSGSVVPIKLYETRGTTTKMPLHLDPGGSAFVVFRNPATSDNFISVSKDGESLITADHYMSEDSSGSERTIMNSFTVSLWVKPETDELLPEKLGAFAETTRYTSSYPVYPPPGKLLFGEGHASFCLLAARNGVAIFEKEDENLNAVLIAKMPLSGWTHFAVVYREGKPALFVNGILTGVGAKSEMIIHPVTIGNYKNDKLFYYDGDLSKPDVFSRPLTDSEVKAIFDNGRPVEDNIVCAGPAPAEAASWLYWKNGNYVFKTASGSSTEKSISGIFDPVELGGPWTVSFPAGHGAPEKVILPKLSSLHTHPEAGVRYFSGTASYNKTFSVDPGMLAEGKRVYLDLGRIAVIAEIVVNGKKMGLVWKPPYRLDITEAVNTGDNDLCVEVTNQWPNRLIGDEQLPEENEYKKFTANGAAIIQLPEWYRQGNPKPDGGRVTFSAWKHFEKDAPLLESGLIGPVIIRNAVIRKI